MALNKFLDPKNDFLFRRLFGEERHKDLLIYFSFRILFSVQSTTFKNSSLYPQTYS